MWFRGVVTTVALLLAGPLASAAAPVADVEKWAQRFQQSALKNNEDELVARVREIADPDFNIDSLRSILKRLDGVVGQQPGDFAEQFNEQTIGSFYKRINVAVRFPQNLSLLYADVRKKFCGLADDGFQLHDQRQ